MDKHAENERLFALDVADCGGNVAEAAKRWEFNAHDPDGWGVLDRAPRWYPDFDYRRRSDAQPLAVPAQAAQPEFSPDWPHGWQTACGYEAGIYETFKDVDGSVHHHGWFIVDGVKRLETWHENGRCMKGHRGDLDLINKPAPKRKVSCWLVMAINRSSGDSCAWVRDTQQEGFTLVRELAAAPRGLYAGAWSHIHGPELIEREV